jgi:hypothetical protein
MEELKMADLNKCPHTYNPCDECPYGIEMREGSGDDSKCKICEFAKLLNRRAEPENTSEIVKKLWELYDKYEDAEHVVCGDAAKLLNAESENKAQKECPAMEHVEGGIPYCAEKQTACDGCKNLPLTLKKLKHMNGQPVWIEKIGCKELSHWIVVEGYDDFSLFSTAGGEYPFIFYAKTWLPYAHEPKGE